MFFFVCDCCMCLAHSPAPTCHAYLDVPRSVGITHSAPTLPRSVHRSQFPALLRVHVHVCCAQCNAHNFLHCCAFTYTPLQMGVAVISTGGTAKTLAASGTSATAPSCVPFYALGMHHHAQPAHESAPAVPVALVEREAERAHMCIRYQLLSLARAARTTLPCAVDTNHSPMCL